MLLAIAVGLYSLAAGWLAKHSVSAAFSFLAIGALLGGAGIAVLGGRIPERALLSLLAEITLALVLFSAASTLRLRDIEGDSKIVLRLIVIGLPLTIAGGTVLALGLFPGISVGLALLMATTLAPTDADLGHQVITDASVPARNPPRPQRRRRTQRWGRGARDHRSHRARRARWLGRSSSRWQTRSMSWSWPPSWAGWPGSGVAGC